MIAAAPSAKAQEQAITLATIRGRVSFFGGLPMTAPCAFINSNLIHYRELSISGAYGSMPRHNRTVLDLLASGRGHGEVLIGLTIPLERLMDAYEAAAAGHVLSGRETGGMKPTRPLRAKPFVSVAQRIPARPTRMAVASGLLRAVSALPAQTGCGAALRNTRPAKSCSSISGPPGVVYARSKSPGSSNSRRHTRIAALRFSVFRWTTTDGRLSSLSWLKEQ